MLDKNRAIVICSFELGNEIVNFINPILDILYRVLPWANLTISFLNTELLNR